MQSECIRICSHESICQFDSWAMVPSHGVPLLGKTNVQSLLLNFRDAIQSVHDQTLMIAIFESKIHRQLSFKHQLFHLSRYFPYGLNFSLLIPSNLDF